VGGAFLKSKIANGAKIANLWLAIFKTKDFVKSLPHFDLCKCCRRAGPQRSPTARVGDL
jgi:hypothetical protein